MFPLLYDDFVTEVRQIEVHVVLRILSRPKCCTCSS